MSSEQFPAECPCGGRKPSGFSSLCETYPRFWPRNQRRAGRIPSCGVPCGGENPAGFSSLLRGYSSYNRNISGMAGISPPYGGCASPSGAQCRHKGVICLPGTMLD
ncbi:MAG: hypothetical protein LBK61_01885 [Spirochaetaceae bacterium]|nr:hypothetical protein [Spirochaetaceae bacterium]